MRNPHEIVDQLSHADALSILRTLMDEDEQIAVRIAEIARARLCDVDPEDVAEALYAEVRPPMPLDGEALLAEVQAFRRSSLGGAYFAPFDMNSRNFSYVPDETNEWFGRLGDLLSDSSQLTAQGDHTHAAACFGMLYELIDAMERGQDIVFAHEYGSWMIPGDEKQYIASYMTSLAATSTVEKFTEVALPLVRRDSRQSFATAAYASVLRSASEAQRAHLEAEIRRQKIRTSRDL